MSVLFLFFYQFNLRKVSLLSNTRIPVYFFQPQILQAGLQIRNGFNRIWIRQWEKTGSGSHPRKTPGSGYYLVFTYSKVNMIDILIL